MDNIGKLRERIRIARLVTTRDAQFGGPVVSWDLSEPLWAAVEHRAAGTSETLSSGQKTADEKVLFTLRFRTVAYTSEIEYRGQRFKIEGVIPDARRTYVTLETQQLGPHA